jgi:phospholipase/carboxylesterase
MVTPPSARAADAARPLVPLSLVHTVREPVAGTLRAGERPPLLLLLHGVGSNERSMASLAGAFDPRFLVVSARSPIALGPDSFAWFHVSFGAEGPVIDASEAAAGWNHVARFVDEVVAAYGVDPARVFVGGFSQGAIMSLAALLTSPERIAGAVAMSGRLLPEVLPHAAAPEALRGKRVLLVHGVDDEKLGIHFARGARQALERFPIQITYRELSMGHAVTPESLAEVAAWLTSTIDDLPGAAPAA